MTADKAKALFTRTASSLTLVFFLVNQVAFASPGAGIEISVSREVPGFLQIDIPADLATLDDIYEAPPSQDPKLILHVQNAHANYGAQQKIKQLLEYLNRNYAINTIFVEGSSEQLDPDYLKFFPDAERNLQLADLLAKQGELTGAELYLLEQSAESGVQSPEFGVNAKAQNSDSKLRTPGSELVKAYGIEDPALYRANYEALKKVFGNEVIIGRYTDGLEMRLAALTSKIADPDMRRILSEWRKFEKGWREFMPFVKSLAQDAKRVLGLDLESLFSQVEWPQITRLIVLQQMEKDLKPQAALEEKDRLIRFLESKRVPGDLIQAITNFKDQHINVTRRGTGGSAEAVQPRYLLERLAREAGPKGFRFSDYPDFSLYAGYLILRSELDSKTLYEEMNRLFAETLDALAVTPAQKELLSVARDEELVRKLLSLELTRRDWKAIRARKDAVAMDPLVERLRKLGKTVNAELHLADTNFETKKINGKFRDNITGLYEAAYTFYDFAHKRESAFYDKISRVMSDKAENKAVLITGGFHTDGVTDLLREHEVNYGVLTPRLMEKSDEKLYRFSMLQKNPTLFDTGTLELFSKMLPRDVIKALGGDPDRVMALLLTQWQKVVQTTLHSKDEIAAELDYLKTFTQGGKFGLTVVDWDLIGKGEEKDSFLVRIGDKDGNLIKNARGQVAVIVITPVALQTARYAVQQQWVLPEGDVSATALGPVKVKFGRTRTVDVPVKKVRRKPSKSQPQQIPVTGGVEATSKVPVRQIVPGNVVTPDFFRQATRAVRDFITVLQQPEGKKKKIEVQRGRAETRSQPAADRAAAAVRRFSSSEAFNRLAPEQRETARATVEAIEQKIEKHAGEMSGAAFFPLDRIFEEHVFNWELAPDQILKFLALLETVPASAKEETHTAFALAGGVFLRSGLESGEGPERFQVLLDKFGALMERSLSPYRGTTSTPGFSFTGLSLINSLEPAKLGELIDRFTGLLDQVKQSAGKDSPAALEALSALLQAPVLQNSGFDDMMNAFDKFEAIVKGVSRYVEQKGDAGLIYSSIGDLHYSVPFNGRSGEEAKGKEIKGLNPAQALAVLDAFAGILDVLNATAGDPRGFKAFAEGFRERGGLGIHDLTPEQQTVIAESFLLPVLFIPEATALAEGVSTKQGKLGSFFAPVSIEIRPTASGYVPKMETPVLRDPPAVRGLLDGLNARVRFLRGFLPDYPYPDWDLQFGVSVADQDAARWSTYEASRVLRSLAHLLMYPNNPVQKNIENLDLLRESGERGLVAGASVFKEGALGGEDMPYWVQVMNFLGWAVRRTPGEIEPLLTELRAVYKEAGLFLTGERAVADDLKALQDSQRTPETRRAYNEAAREVRNGIRKVVAPYLAPPETRTEEPVMPAAAASVQAMPVSASAGARRGSLGPDTAALPAGEIQVGEPEHVFTSLSRAKGTGRGSFGPDFRAEARTTKANIRLGVNEVVLKGGLDKDGRDKVVGRLTDSLKLGDNVVFIMRDANGLLIGRFTFLANSLYEQAHTFRTSAGDVRIVFKQSKIPGRETPRGSVDLEITGKVIATEGPVTRRRAETRALTEQEITRVKGIFITGLTLLANDARDLPGQADQIDIERLGNKENWQRIFEGLGFSQDSVEAAAEEAVRLFTAARTEVEQRGGDETGVGEFLQAVVKQIATPPTLNWQDPATRGSWLWENWESPIPDLDGLIGHILAQLDQAAWSALTISGKERALDLVALVFNRSTQSSASPFFDVFGKVLVAEAQLKAILAALEKLGFSGAKSDKHGTEAVIELKQRLLGPQWTPDPSLFDMSRFFSIRLPWWLQNVRLMEAEIKHLQDKVRATGAVIGTLQKAGRDTSLLEAARREWETQLAELQGKLKTLTSEAPGASAAAEAPAFRAAAEGEPETRAKMKVGPARLFSSRALGLAAVIGLLYFGSAITVFSRTMDEAKAAITNHFVELGYKVKDPNYLNGIAQYWLDDNRSLFTLPSEMVFSPDRLKYALDHELISPIGQPAAPPAPVVRAAPENAPASPEAVAPRGGSLLDIHKAMEKAPAEPAAQPAPVVTVAPENAPAVADTVSPADLGDLQTAQIETFPAAVRAVGTYIKGPGVDQNTGAPNDHAVIDGKVAGNVGNYGAPSKDAMLASVLLHIILKNPAFAGMDISTQEALEACAKQLASLLRFQREYEGREVSGGFFPWQSFGSGQRRLTPYANRRMVPTLDNSFTTAALLAVAGQLGADPQGTLSRRVGALAQAIVGNQDWEKYVSPDGFLYAEYNLDRKRGEGLVGGNNSSLWTEWPIASLLAYLDGKITLQDWLRVNAPMAVWQSPAGPVDLPTGFNYSMHELWILQFFGPAIMKSDLAPLLRNYLYFQTVHAVKYGLPAYPATEFSWENDYRQAGIISSEYGVPQFGSVPANGKRMASGYAAAIGMAISPKAGLWLAQYLRQPGVMTPYGPVTSVSREGASTYMTADSTFTMTHMIAETARPDVYLGIVKFFSRKWGVSEAEAEKRIIGAFNAQTAKIRGALGRDFRAVSEDQILLPPVKLWTPTGEVEVAPPRLAVNELTPRLAGGAWDGQKAMVRAQGGEISGTFPRMQSREFGFAGSPVTPSIPVDDVRYLTFEVPAGWDGWQKGVVVQLEMKDGDLDAFDRVNLSPGTGTVLGRSQDGKNDVILVELDPSAKGKRINYIAFSTNDNLSRGKEATFRLAHPVFHKERPSKPPRISRSEFRRIDTPEIFRGVFDQDALERNYRASLSASAIRSETRAGAKENFTAELRQRVVQSLEGYLGAGNVEITPANADGTNPPEIILAATVNRDDCEGAGNALMQMAQGMERVLPHDMDLQYAYGIAKVDTAGVPYGKAKVSVRLALRAETRIKPLITTQAEAEARRLGPREEKTGPAIEQAGQKWWRESSDRESLLEKWVLRPAAQMLSIGAGIGTVFGASLQVASRMNAAYPPMPNVVAATALGLLAGVVMGGGLYAVLSPAVKAIGRWDLNRPNRYAPSWLQKTAYAIMTSAKLTQLGWLKLRILLLRENNRDLQARLEQAQMDVFRPDRTWEVAVALYSVFTSFIFGGAELALAASVLSGTALTVAGAVIAALGVFTYFAIQSFLTPKTLSSTEVIQRVMSILKEGKPLHFKIGLSEGIGFEFYSGTPTWQDLLAQSLKASAFLVRVKDEPLAKTVIIRPLPATMPAGKRAETRTEKESVQQEIEALTNRIGPFEKLIGTLKTAGNDTSRMEEILRGQRAQLEELQAELAELSKRPPAAERKLPKEKPTALQKLVKDLQKQFKDLKFWLGQYPTPEETKGWPPGAAGGAESAVGGGVRQIQDAIDMLISQLRAGLKGHEKARAGVAAVRRAIDGYTAKAVGNYPDAELAAASAAVAEKIEALREKLPAPVTGPAGPRAETRIAEEDFLRIKEGVADQLAILADPADRAAVRARLDSFKASADLPAFLDFVVPILDRMRGLQGVKRYETLQAEDLVLIDDRVLGRSSVSREQFDRTVDALVDLAKQLDPAEAAAVEFEKFSWELSKSDGVKWTDSYGDTYEVSFTRRPGVWRDAKIEITIVPKRSFFWSTRLTGVVPAENIPAIKKFLETAIANRSWWLIGRFWENDLSPASLRKNLVNRFGVDTRHPVFQSFKRWSHNAVRIGWSDAQKEAPAFDDQSYRSRAGMIAPIMAEREWKMEGAKAQSRIESDRSKARALLELAAVPHPHSGKNRKASGKLAQFSPDTLRELLGEDLNTDERAILESILSTRAESRTEEEDMKKLFVWQKERETLILSRFEAILDAMKPTREGVTAAQVKAHAFNVIPQSDSMQWTEILVRFLEGIDVLKKRMPHANPKSPGFIVQIWHYTGQFWGRIGTVVLNDGINYRLGSDLVAFMLSVNSDPEARDFVDRLRERKGLAQLSDLFTNSMTNPGSSAVFPPTVGRDHPIIRTALRLAAATGWDLEIRESKTSTEIVFKSRRSESRTDAARAETRTAVTAPVRDLIMQVLEAPGEIEATAPDSHDKGWKAAKDADLLNPDNPFTGWGINRVKVSDEIKAKSREQLSTMLGFEVSEQKYQAILKSPNGNDITHPSYKPFAQTAAEAPDGGVTMIGQNSVPLLVFTLFLADVQKKAALNKAELKKFLQGLLDGSDQESLRQLAVIHHIAFQSGQLVLGFRGYPNKLPKPDAQGKEVVLRARDDFKPFEWLTPDVQSYDIKTMIFPIKHWLAQIETIEDGSSEQGLINARIEELRGQMIASLEAAFKDNPSFAESFYVDLLRQGRFGDAYVYLQHSLRILEAEARRHPRASSSRAPDFMTAQTEAYRQALAVLATISELVKPRDRISPTFGQLDRASLPLPKRMDAYEKLSALNGKHKDRAAFAMALEAAIRSVQDPETRIFLWGNMGRLHYWRDTKGDDSYGVSREQDGGYVLTYDDYRGDRVTLFTPKNDMAIDEGKLKAGAKQILEAADKKSGVFDEFNRAVIETILSIEDPETRMFFFQNAGRLQFQKGADGKYEFIRNGDVISMSPMRAETRTGPGAAGDFGEMWATLMKELMQADPDLEAAVRAGKKDEAARMRGRLISSHWPARLPDPEIRKLIRRIAKETGSIELPAEWRVPPKGPAVTFMPGVMKMLANGERNGPYIKQLGDELNAPWLWRFFLPLAGEDTLGVETIRTAYEGHPEAFRKMVELIGQGVYNTDSLVHTLRVLWDSGYEARVRKIREELVADPEKFADTYLSQRPALPWEDLKERLARESLDLLSRNGVTLDDLGGFYSRYGESIYTADGNLLDGKDWIIWTVLRRKFIDTLHKFPDSGWSNGGEDVMSSQTQSNANHALSVILKIVREKMAEGSLRAETRAAGVAGRISQAWKSYKAYKDNTRIGQWLIEESNELKDFWGDTDGGVAVLILLGMFGGALWGSLSFAVASAIPVPVLNVVVGVVMFAVPLLVSEMAQTIAMILLRMLEGILMPFLRLGYGLVTVPFWLWDGSRAFLRLRAGYETLLMKIKGSAEHKEREQARLDQARREAIVWDHKKSHHPSPPSLEEAEINYLRDWIEYGKILRAYDFDPPSTSKGFEVLNEKRGGDLTRRFTSKNGAVNWEWEIVKLLREAAKTDSKFAVPLRYRNLLWTYDQLEGGETVLGKMVLKSRIPVSAKKELLALAHDPAQFKVRLDAMQQELSGRKDKVGKFLLYGGVIGLAGLIALVFFGGMAGSFVAKDLTPAMTARIDSIASVVLGALGVVSIQSMLAGVVFAGRNPEKPYFNLSLAVNGLGAGTLSPVAARMQEIHGMILESNLPETKKSELLALPDRTAVTERIAQMGIELMKKRAKLENVFWISGSVSWVGGALIGMIYYAAAGHVYAKLGEVFRDNRVVSTLFSFLGIMGITGVAGGTWADKSRPEKHFNALHTAIDKLPQVTAVPAAPAPAAAPVVAPAPVVAERKAVEQEIARLKERIRATGVMIKNLAGNPAAVRGLEKALAGLNAGLQELQEKLKTLPEEAPAAAPAAPASGEEQDVSAGVPVSVTVFTAWVNAGEVRRGARIDIKAKPSAGLVTSNISDAEFHLLGTDGRIFFRYSDAMPGANSPSLTPEEIESITVRAETRTGLDPAKVGLDPATKVPGDYLTFFEEAAVALGETPQEFARKAMDELRGLGYTSAIEKVEEKAGKNPTFREAVAAVDGDDVFIAQLIYGAALHVKTRLGMKQELKFLEQSDQRLAGFDGQVNMYHRVFDKEIMDPVRKALEAVRKDWTVMGQPATPLAGAVSERESVSREIAQLKEKIRATGIMIKNLAKNPAAVQGLEKALGGLNARLQELQEKLKTLPKEAPPPAPKPITPAPAPAPAAEPQMSQPDLAAAIRATLQLIRENTPGLTVVQVRPEEIIDPVEANTGIPDKGELHVGDILTLQGGSLLTRGFAPSLQSHFTGMILSKDRDKREVTVLVFSDVSAAGPITIKTYPADDLMAKINGSFNETAGLFRLKEQGSLEGLKEKLAQIDPSAFPRSETRAAPPASGAWTKSQVELASKLLRQWAHINSKDLLNTLTTYGKFPKGLAEKLIEIWKKDPDEYLLDSSRYYAPRPVTVDSAGFVKVRDALVNINFKKTSEFEFVRAVLGVVASGALTPEDLQGFAVNYEHMHAPDEKSIYYYYLYPEKKGPGYPSEDEFVDGFLTEMTGDPEAPGYWDDLEKRLKAGEPVVMTRTALGHPKVKEEGMENMSLRGHRQKQKGNDYWYSFDTPTGAHNESPHTLDETVAKFQTFYEMGKAAFEAAAKGDKRAVKTFLAEWSGEDFHNTFGGQDLAKKRKKSGPAVPAAKPARQASKPVAAPKKPAVDAALEAEIKQQTDRRNALKAAIGDNQNHPSLPTLMRLDEALKTLEAKRSKPAAAATPAAPPKVKAASVKKAPSDRTNTRAAHRSKARATDKDFPVDLLSEVEVLESRLEQFLVRKDVQAFLRGSITLGELIEALQGQFDAFRKKIAADPVEARMAKENGQEVAMTAADIFMAHAREWIEIGLSPAERVILNEGLRGLVAEVSRVAFSRAGNIKTPVELYLGNTSHRHNFLQMEQAIRDELARTKATIAGTRPDPSDEAPYERKPYVAVLEKFLEDYGKYFRAEQREEMVLTVREMDRLAGYLRTVKRLPDVPGAENIDGILAAMKTDNPNGQLFARAEAFAKGLPDGTKAASFAKKDIMGLLNAVRARYPMPAPPRPETRMTAQQMIDRKLPQARENERRALAMALAAYKPAPEDVSRIVTDILSIAQVLGKNGFPGSTKTVMQAAATAFQQARSAGIILPVAKDNLGQLAVNLRDNVQFLKKVLWLLDNTEFGSRRVGFEAPHFSSIMINVLQNGVLKAGITEMYDRLNAAQPAAAPRNESRFDLLVPQRPEAYKGLTGGHLMQGRQRVQEQQAMNKMAEGLRARDFEAKLSKTALDLLDQMEFSDISLADEARTQDAALKVAFLVRGILDLANSDLDEAVRQMQALANALGAAAMQAVINALPKGHVLPVSNRLGRIVQFVAGAGDIRDQFAVVKIMLALNSGQKYTFVVPDKTAPGLLDELRKDYESWAKSVASKAGLSEKVLLDHFRIYAETDFGPVAAGLHADTLVAVAKGAREQFKAKGGIFEMIRQRSKIVDLEYDATDKQANPAAQTGLVKLSHEVAKFAAAAKKGGTPKMASDIEKQLADIIKNLPEFVYDAKSFKLSITNDSLRLAIARVWQEFQAVMQTAIAA